MISYTISREALKKLPLAPVKNSKDTRPADLTNVSVVLKQILRKRK